MAGHHGSGSSEKSPNDLPTFNAENMKNNMKAIHYSQTFMSIIGGVIAGISGFFGLTGFVFYFLVMAITSIGLIAKAGFTIHSYFDSWNQIIFDGILGGLMVENLGSSYCSTPSNDHIEQLQATPTPVEVHLNKSVRCYIQAAVFMAIMLVLILGLYVAL